MASEPRVFRYERAADGSLRLYVGGLSTADALAQFPDTTAVRIVRFGATAYRTHGYATEKDLPALATGHALRSFLEREGDQLGLIECEVELEGIGTLATHDDGECHFVLRDRATLIAVVQKSLPPEQAGAMVNAVFAHAGMYVTYDPSGAVRAFPTFDGYLAGT